MAYLRDVGVVYSSHGHGSQEGTAWYPVFVFKMILSVGASRFIRLLWKQSRMGLDVNASCLLCEIRESSCLKA